MRKKIEDIRPRSQSEFYKPALSSVTGEFSSVSRKSQEASWSYYNEPEEESIDLLELQRQIESEEIKRIENPIRRNFLKIMMASGGVLLANTFLSKINKFNNINIINQAVSSSGTIALPQVEGEKQENSVSDDFQAFFKNFRLVRNRNEYVLYDRHGDSIISIDRDA